MESLAKYIDGVKFEVESRGHKIVCDQPPTNGGADEGMTPPEFLLAALSTCAGFYAVQYLKARNLPASGVTVNVKGEKLLQPARVGTFQIEVNVPELDDERHREGVLRAVKSCLIHNTLLNAPAIDIVLNVAADATLVNSGGTR